MIANRSVDNYPSKGQQYTSIPGKGIRTVKMGRAMRILHSIQGKMGQERGVFSGYDPRISSIHLPVS